MREQKRCKEHSSISKVFNLCTVYALLLHIKE